MDPLIITSAVLRDRGMDPRELGLFSRMYPDGAPLTTGNVLRMLRAGIGIRSLVRTLGGDLSLYDRVVESARMRAQEAEAEGAMEAINLLRKQAISVDGPGMEEVWEQLRRDTALGAEPAVIRLTVEEYTVARRRISDLEGALRRLLASPQVKGVEGEGRPGGDRSASKGLLAEARNLLEGGYPKVP